MWQARAVQQQLERLGHATELCPVVSSGDKNLTQPLYTLGITGVFTRDLDIALLNGDIDIAVHSLKDVPTQLPAGVTLLGCLERDFPQDVLLRRASAQGLDLSELKIATSSLRRRAFWKKEFPHTQFFDIRGNVQTRLQKLETQDFDATIFSLAGLRRMEYDLPVEPLPMMISAPAQGVIGIAGRSSNENIRKIISQISHRPTEICVTIERQFLQTLEGGCTAPIGALATILDDGRINFVARFTDLNGQRSLDIHETFAQEDADDKGKQLAEQLLHQGGAAIMAEIKAAL